jgi:micrococcal nuclease
MLAVIAAAALALPSPARASVVRLDFNTLPPATEWGNVKSSGSATVSNSILTISAPSGYNEFAQGGSTSKWFQEVSSIDGWAVEMRLRIDPITDPDCGESVVVWIHDETQLINLGFSPNAVCMSVPGGVAHPMNTTSAFHTYRIEGQLNRVWIYVDGALIAEHRIHEPWDGTHSLFFGDGNQGTTSRSYWDWFQYDTAPVLRSVQAPRIDPASCTVARVLDGDTFDCTDGRSVRMLQMVSLPMNECGGRTAQAALANIFLTPGKQVRFEYDAQKSDRYGRVLAAPIVTGTDGADYNISIVMVYVGLAKSAQDGANVRYLDWARAAENWARYAQWNLWEPDAQYVTGHTVCPGDYGGRPPPR